MAGIEQNQAIEKHEYSKEECDNKLCQLEEKIDIDFPFEKNDNGTYSIIKDNIKLDIEITSDNLIEANKEILQLLTFFKQNSNGSSHFYEDWFDGSLDMEQAGFNSEYLLNETFKELFGGEENKQKLINFLHLILGVSETNGDFNYNKSNAAPDYIDLVDMQENELLISSIQEKYSNFEESLKGKNIQEIKNSFGKINRESSLLLALFIIKNPIIINEGSIGVSTIRSITYNNMRYSYENLEQSVTGANMRGKYEGGAFIELQQHSRTRGKLQLVNHNDQIILNRLLGNTSKDDYKIPASTTKYMGTEK